MKPLWHRTGRVLMAAILGIIGAAHAHEWQITDDTTFGIEVEIELAYVLTDPGKRHHTREWNDSGSEISFFGAHEFSDGWSVYSMAQFEYALDEADQDTVFETDDVYFGINSRFGTVQIGDWDGIYDNKVDDVLDVFEVAGPSAAFNTPSGDSAAWLSPSVNGISLAVQGFFKGVDNDADNENEGQSFQAVLEYEAEHFGIYLGYDDRGLDDGQRGSIGLAASVDLAPLTLSAKIESEGEDASGSSLLDKQGFMVYGVAAAYDYGPGRVVGVINQVEPRADQLDGRTEFGVNVNYEVTDWLHVYVEHFRYDRPSGEGNTSAAGLVYEF